MQETSLLAYEDIKKTLGKRQYEVYFTLKKLRCANNTQIAHDMGIPINRVTGRINELRKFGIVGAVKKDKCPHTGSMVLFWGICPPKPHFTEPEQLELEIF